MTTWAVVLSAIIFLALIIWSLKNGGFHHNMLFLLFFALFLLLL